MINKILILLGVVICIHLLTKYYNKRIENFYGLFKSDAFWSVMCLSNPFPITLSLGGMFDKVFGGIKTAFTKLRGMLSTDIIGKIKKLVKNMVTPISYT